MQPLTKALRRRLKRLAPELGEQDIERFEHERRVAMQAALCEDPLYAAALEPEPGPGPEQPTLGLAARAAPPREAAEAVRVVRQLGPLVLRAAEDERRGLDRKADRALARQGEAARPKRSLARPVAKKKAASKVAVRKTAVRKTASKKTAAKKSALKKPARKPVSRAPRRGR